MRCKLQRDQLLALATTAGIDEETYQTCMRGIAYIDQQMKVQDGV